jgi:hypothetical protein
MQRLVRCSIENLEHSLRQKTEEKRDPAVCFVGGNTGVLYSSRKFKTWERNSDGNPEMIVIDGWKDGRHKHSSEICTLKAVAISFRLLLLFFRSDASICTFFLFRHYTFTMMMRLILLTLIASPVAAFLPSTPTSRTFIALKAKNADWLSDLKKEAKSEETKLVESVFSQAQNGGGGDQVEEKSADIHLPTTGVSVSETMEEALRDTFKTELVPVTTLPGVAQIVTKATSGSFDPIRYLVALTPPTLDEEGNIAQTEETQHYVMTDIPAYSDRLAAMIRKHMGPSGKLSAIIMTSRSGVHYDEGPGVFTSRKSDLGDWKAVFPHVKVVGYRLDIPRDCNQFVSQKLNGNGPWAWDDETRTFEETGRPLVTVEWDAETIKAMMATGLVPPDEENDNVDEALYTPESIRQKEEGKRLIAVYTPGHTHGTVSYVFPETNVVVSGFTIPIEDAGTDNKGQYAAPAMDARGYITTSGAGMTKQMESARHLVNTYADRFGVILPARDDPFFLDEMDKKERKGAILRIIDQYDQIGKIYSQLGIFSDDDLDDDDDASFAP